MNKTSYNAFNADSQSENHYTNKSTADILIEKVMPQFAHYSGMTHHSYTGNGESMVDKPLVKDFHKSLDGMLDKNVYSSKTVMDHMNSLSKPFYSGIGLY